VKPLRAVAAAFSYFSIAPVRSFGAAPDDAAVAWLPLVGIAIGILCGLGAEAAYVYLHSRLWAVVVAFAGSIVLSGAIHVDGFLDCADALTIAATPQRRLEVLHDPRHGTFAVVAMALLALVWLAALANISPLAMPFALAVAAAVARASVLPAMQFYPHARTQARHKGLYVSGLLWFIVLAAGGFRGHGWPALALLIGAYAFAWVLAYGMSRRLGGGLTGDAYGAIVVIVEVAVLISSPAIH
jgi:adenosylcobinamide-GDP ribazoletransferase